MKVLHIGLHKTASTYLQTMVFPKLSGVNYYGNGDIFTNWRSGLHPKPGNTALWSTEAALGWPFPDPEPPRISELMALCHDLGVTDLLVVKRSYPAWVCSVWYQTLNGGGWESFQRWYTQHNQELETWRSVFRELDRKAKKNAINLKIISHEALLERPQSTISELAEFLGTSPPNELDYTKRVNESRKGTYLVSVYRGLNFIVRGRRVKRLLALFRITPRMLLQYGQLGGILQRASKHDIRMPEELSKLDWIDAD